MSNLGLTIDHKTKIVTLHMDGQSKPLTTQELKFLAEVAASGLTFQPEEYVHLAEQVMDHLSQVYYDAEELLTGPDSTERAGKLLEQSRMVDHAIDQYKDASNRLDNQYAAHVSEPIIT